LLRPTPEWRQKLPEKCFQMLTGGWEYKWQGQIKQMLDTQYPRESSLNAILDYVELLTKAGLVSQEKPVLKK